ncbi:MAG TPA: uracil-DNA glycosylase family protein [Thermoleophilia bacterium]|nr:uracil-DNA glycosylase family protein [Thermoleophilia bacterium]
MDDAVEQLDNLARSIGACVRCDELVANRLRAVPGGGHPHCAVMVVTLHPDPADEAGDGLAGEALVADLAEFMPALAERRDQVYVTTLLKCVPRTDCVLRAPHSDELGNCYPYLSRELTITTPHYVLTVGEDATRYLLGRLFKDRPYAQDDSLELRLFDNPAFKVVPVATPDELRARDAKTRKEYTERLRKLAQIMGL